MQNHPESLTSDAVQSVFLPCGAANMYWRLTWANIGMHAFMVDRTAISAQLEFYHDLRERQTRLIAGRERHRKREVM